MSHISISETGTQTLLWCRNNIQFLVFVAVLIVTVNLFLYQFLQQETYIYFWAWSYYHLKFDFTVGLFHQGVPNAVIVLFESIAFTEHSLLAPFLVAPFGLLFGTERTVFLFSVLNVFALPAALLFGIVFMRLTAAYNHNNWFYAAIPITIVFLTPQFWTPITRGYFDVSVLIGICIIWLILLSRFESKPNIKAVGIGAVLTALVFDRRWIVIWVVSFFPAVFLEWAARTFKKRSPLLSLKIIIVTGLSALALFLFFAKPLFLTMLTTDYGTAFQAYRHGHTTLRIIVQAVLYYGWLSLCFAAAGFFLARKDYRNRAFLYIVGLQTFIALLLFVRVHGPGDPHHYPFVITIALFQALFLFYLWKCTLKDVWKWLLSGLFALVLVINFLQVLVPQWQLRAEVTHLFAEHTRYPLVRYDTEEISRLITFLDELVPADSNVYLVASSGTLNSDVLKNACWYLQLEHVSVCDRVLVTHDVDLRDGFPKPFLDAEYVVLGIPTQYHLLPADQQVVGVLAEKLTDAESIGAAYEIVPEEFELRNDVSAVILIRTRPLSEKEQNDLLASFLESYPGREDLFNLLPEPRTSNNTEW